MENYKYIQDKLNNGKMVILDGANGSELEKRGAQMDGAGWCGPASMTHPKILEDIHKDYIAAGAEVITTNIPYMRFIPCSHYCKRANR